MTTLPNTSSRKFILNNIYSEYDYSRAVEDRLRDNKELQKILDDRDREVEDLIAELEGVKLEDTELDDDINDFTDIIKDSDQNTVIIKDAIAQVENELRNARGHRCDHDLHVISSHKMNRQSEIKDLDDHMGQLQKELDRAIKEKNDLQLSINERESSAKNKVQELELAEGDIVNIKQQLEQDELESVEIDKNIRVEEEKIGLLNAHMRE
jgi:chromosome segregation ATPase